MPEDAIYTVTEVYPDHVVLDGNHPLAGIALRLALTVRDVREASEEEIEAGSVGSSASACSAPRRRARTCTEAPRGRDRAKAGPLELRRQRRVRRRGGARRPPASAPGPCR